MIEKTIWINDCNDICGSIEDVQDNVNEKLAKLFSFYHEQEFLDEINNVE